MDETEVDRILISETSIPSNTLHFDADVTKMDGLINEWLSYLKHNILNQFIQTKTNVIKLKQQELEVQEQRHRNEIIKFQSKIRNLQKELSVCHNGICKREDDKYGEENEINGLKETPESVTTQKKHCKDILLQALIAERKKNRTLKLFHKWRSMCKGKQINGVQEKVVKDWEWLVNIKTEEMQGSPSQDDSSQEFKLLRTVEPVPMENQNCEMPSIIRERDGLEKRINEKLAHQTKKKNFICEMCRKYFSRSDNIIPNMATDDEATIYKCQVCQSEFKRQLKTGKHVILKPDNRVKNIVENGNNSEIRITRDAVTHGTVPFNTNAPDSTIDEVSTTVMSTNVTVNDVTKDIDDRFMTSQNREYSEPFSDVTSHVNSHMTLAEVQNQQHQKRRANQELWPESSPKVYVESKRFFRCDKCQKYFSARSSLYNHQVYVHSKSSQHQCTICDKYLPSASHLKTHMSYHEGTKGLKCVQCYKRFSTNASLLGHMKCHTDYRPFMCELCDDQFKSKCALNTHMRRHTDEKPFACEICGKEFSHCGTLNTHMRIHLFNTT